MGEYYGGTLVLLAIGPPLSGATQYVCHQWLPVHIFLREAWIAPVARLLPAELRARSGLQALGTVRNRRQGRSLQRHQPAAGCRQHADSAHSRRELRSSNFEERVPSTASVSFYGAAPLLIAFRPSKGLRRSP